MIDSLHIKNFQSHEDSTFTFHPGVNAIIGPTDNGKSASLRALRWIIFNKPQGAQYISHWNRKKNGDPKAPTYAKVSIDSTEVTRERSPEGNGYKLDSRFLTSVGKSVPDEVSTILGISELNVARQHDAPFLLCSSGGEVATYLNSLVHLDTIDKAYSSADSLKRSITKELSIQQERLTKAEASLSGLAWVEKADDLVSLLRQEGDALQELRETHASVSMHVEALRKHKEALGKVKLVEEAEKLIEARHSVLVANQEIEKTVDAIFGYLNALERHKETLKLASIVEKADKYIGKLNARKESLEKLLTEKKKISSLLEELSMRREQIERDEASLKLWEDKLPDICPLCGK